MPDDRLDVARRSTQARLVPLAQERLAPRAVGSGQPTGGHPVTIDEHAERFTALRPLLFTIAYEILGTATESDDVLQESYLRWAEVDLSTVLDTKAYLARLVTRQSLSVPTNVRYSYCGRCSASITTKSPLLSENRPPRCVRSHTVRGSTSTPGAGGSSPSMPNSRWR